MTKVLFLPPAAGGSKLKAKLKIRRRRSRALANPRFEIDPLDTRFAISGPVPAVLPKRVREFAHIPRLSVLLPGDLILMRYVHPETLSNLHAQKIEEAQLDAGFAARDAIWTHAAIYAGDGCVVEGVLRGVCYRSLFDYVPQRAMRFRRDTALSAEQQLALVLAAMKMLGQKYSVWKIPKAYLRLVLGLWNPLPHSNIDGARVCSTVFSDAHFSASHRPLEAVHRSSIVTPAALSFTPTLADINVGWLKIE